MSGMHRKELTLFPRIHTGRATFTASGVPVLDVTYQVLAFEVVDLGYPSKAHQFKHGTTRHMTTPTMLENKMSLLQLSSAFLTSSVFPWRTFTMSPPLQ